MKIMGFVLITISLLISIFIYKFRIGKINDTFVLNHKNLFVTAFVVLWFLGMYMIITLK